MVIKKNAKSRSNKREENLCIKFRIFQGWSRMENSIVYILEEYNSYFWGLFHVWEPVVAGCYYLVEDKAIHAMRATINERKRKTNFKIEHKVLGEYTETGELVKEQVSE